MEYPNTFPFSLAPGRFSVTPKFVPENTPFAYFVE